uniref:Uncharacterized protein n=1 Tax=Anguilla anguilla TaxID=7936 RepID=A0A0E9RRL9_ANGAN
MCVHGYVYMHLSCQHVYIFIYAGPQISRESFQGPCYWIESDRGQQLKSIKTNPLPQSPQ